MTTNNFERNETVASETKGYTLEASNLVGTVTDISPSDSATRSDSEKKADAVAEKLNTLNMTLDGAIEIEVTEQTRTPETGTRSTPTQGTVLHTDIADKTFNRDFQSVDQGAAALVYDHNTGAFHWVPPTEDDTQTRGSGASFVLPDLPEQPEELPPDEQEEVATRGVMGNLVRRSVFVVRWIIGDNNEQTARAVASAWEKQNSNNDYGFLHVDPTAADEEQLWQTFNATGEDDAGNKEYKDANDWSRYDGKRSLLLIHGTFGRVQTSYQGTMKHVPDDLKRKYEGRIFAFNHPTLTETPEQNAAYFTSQVPDGVQLELDIVMHSRAGLVGREVIDAIAQHSLGVVKKAIFVGAANNGTIIVDEDNWNEFGNRFMNMFGFLPDAISVPAEGVLLVLKIGQEGFFDGLPGLKAMEPDGDYLKQLAQKSSHGTKYYALVTNYEPKQRGNIFRRFVTLATEGVADTVIDTVFKGVDNDLIVPTAGAYTLGELNSEVNGFPIPEERISRFPKPDGIPVHHVAFFNHGETSKPCNQQIIDWLMEAD